MSKKDTLILNKVIAKLSHVDGTYGSEALWNLIARRALPVDQNKWANLIVREAVQIAMDETMAEMEEI